MEIKTLIGGPYLYKQGTLEDGTKTGRVRWVMQSKEELERELLDTLKTGRDDVRAFVNSL